MSIYYKLEEIQLPVPLSVSQKVSYFITFVAVIGKLCNISPIALIRSSGHISIFVYSLWYRYWFWLPLMQSDH